MSGTAENTGGYVGAREVLAQRYGMNNSDCERMGPQVMRHLAKFARKRHDAERSHKSGKPKGLHLGGHVR